MSSASLAVFRMAFGVAMAVNAALYMRGHVREYYIDTEVNFPYGPLDFVRPLPGSWLYAVYALMVVTGVLIAIGRWYRWAAGSFFVLTTYVFLLDSTYYQNHEYLISLLALMLALLPANCRWSLDARSRPEVRSGTVPAWIVWLLRFQVGVPYVFGGIAKLNGDWLRGEPLRRWLAARTDLEPFHTILTTEWVVWLMAYGALVLDLAIVGLLLWPRTRLAALVVVTGFHLLNAWLFGLFIFPWLMIAATTVFLPPSWPERVLERGFRGARSLSTEPAALPPPARRVAPVLLPVFAIWVVVQLVVPMRHHLITGSPSWTEEGHRFSWHMKLREKSGTITFVVSNDGQTTRVDPSEHLGRRQAWRLPGHPERLVRFAHHLSRRHGGAVVTAETSVSLNGRAPQPIVDPTVDLASIEPLWWGPAPWIIPLDTPLRS